MTPRDRSYSEAYAVCALVGIATGLLPIVFLEAFAPQVVNHSHQPWVSLSGGLIAMCAYAWARLLWRAGER